MIRRLLVANRGEIARRIFRTARAMGIETVAVASEADIDAPHALEADRSLLIGPPPAAESYLSIPKILAAAKEAGADAIHPGYGFLSENAEFAEAVTAADLTWVGAPPAAIRAMGLKDAAKRLMSEAGVPVTPGYLGEDQSAERLAAEAAAIGYPVLIKAVAGGGGKGMRRVDDPAAFADALASARREAAAAFGDERVLLETYVRRPRHIEVQVFGDAHGNVVHLFERDCSLQRRHQKVIEEAPAPGLDEPTRAAICTAAVRAAQAVGYQGAGTVEFIADASEGLSADRIWFMEMNTRLQVEHPVTEAITGLDLVEWQLRVAAGEPLPLTQDEIVRSGHAIEARLYAEQPAEGFRPSVGDVDHLRWPPGVRVDAGVEAGGAVSRWYDPMIAKLIAHGPSREAALAALGEACDALEIWPLAANACFLARCLDDPDFIAGDVDTGFIEARLEALTTRPDPSEAALAAAAEAALMADDDSPWGALAGFRLNADPERSLRLYLGNRSFLAPAAGADERSVLLTDEGQIVVFEAGEAFAFTTRPPQPEAGEGGAGEAVVRAPMPGKVVALAVAAGQTVTRGQPLVTLEAMKMEHVLTAPFDGEVEAVSAEVGAQVSEGAALLKLKAPD